MNNPLIAFFVLVLLTVAMPREKAPTLASPLHPIPSMKPFVILFRQGPNLLSDADKTRRQTAISAWAREQNAAGHKLEPRSLAPSFTRPGIAVPADAVGQWPVTALLFIDARDLDEATTVAASHPARDYGVSMEVRPWSTPVPASARP